jgi:proteasome lid subunit RPN8/RPN11
MSASRFRLLRIPADLFADLLAQAKAERPLECCGLLAGTAPADGIADVAVRYALPNAVASAREYQGDLRAVRAALEDIDRRGLDLLAVYHSHPTSAPVPSRTDLERNAFGQTLVHLIVSLTTDPPGVRGWWLGETEYREAEWKEVKELTTQTQRHQVEKKRE